MFETMQMPFQSDVFAAIDATVIIIIIVTS